MKASDQTSELAAPPAPDRKADQIAAELMRRIVTGELTPGAILPREERLAEEFDVTRGVVREAMRGLEVHRLVRPAKRRGTEVLDPIASFTPAVLRAMLVPAGKGVDPRMLADVLELRAHLDTLMNALAAERRTDADLAALDAVVLRLEEAFHEPRRYVRAMDDLGLAIARATGNRLFEMLAHWHMQVAEDLDDLIFLVRFPTEPQLAGIRHLVEAIRGRDVETARALTSSFHEWANRRLLEAVGAPPAVMNRHFESSP